MADSVCTRTSAQSPYTIFDQWADEGAAARAAHCPSHAGAQQGALSALRGENPRPGEDQARLYPRSISRDLQAALTVVDRIEAQSPAESASWRLVSLAANWLAQVVRDLGYSRVLEDHTSEFVQTLNDVLALLRGVIALQVDSMHCVQLASAAMLIERAMETLAHADEVTT